MNSTADRTAPSPRRTANAEGHRGVVPESVAVAVRRAPRRCASASAARARRDLDAAASVGADRLLLTLDPSDPGSSAALDALRAAVGADRVTTRPAGASVLVDVALDSTTSPTGPAGPRSADAS